MAATPSNMIPLGTPAPGFRLPDHGASGGARLVGIEDFAASPALVVMFLCNHCPFVKHVRATLTALATDLTPRGAAFVAISSNDVETHPDDSPDLMEAEAREAGYPFPYLYDASQEIARAYRAACTPDFYVFDAERRLVYRGQLDDSRPNSQTPCTGADLRAAIEDALAGRPAPSDQRPSIGCNIKWKPGIASA